ncbi:MAG: GrpB family protein [Armatimonadota bacterium]|nr:GrpB family protein [bacterium]
MIRLIGGLYDKGSDGFADFLKNLFPRLGAEVRRTACPARYVGYEAAGAEAGIRFFGAEVERIDDIPNGMIALELNDYELTVYESATGKPGIVWRGGLRWTWRTVSGIGEFEADCPPGWGSVFESVWHRFNIFAHTYIAADKICDDEVFLVNYDPAWPGQFDEMACRIKSELGDIALRIEHYGSTAIPNMPAKPIIDILVEVLSPDVARERTMRVFDWPECEVWNYSDHIIVIVRSELMGRRTHHVHVAPTGHKIWDGLAFRDYLCQHSDDAARYAALKRELAAIHRCDREAYTNAKGAFVMEIVEKVRQSA